MDQMKLRSIKARVEENSLVLDRMVDKLVEKYSNDLHEFIKEAKGLVERRNAIGDEDLENLILKLPIYMYFAGSGLETLGIDADNAEAVRKEAYNALFLDGEGSVTDRAKTAENETFSEQLVEIAFTRAYKKLKTLLENADRIFSGAKKIYSKRMVEMEVQLREVNKTLGREDDVDDNESEQRYDE